MPIRLPVDGTVPKKQSWMPLVSVVFTSTFLLATIHIEITSSLYSVLPTTTTTTTNAVFDNVIEPCVSKTQDAIDDMLPIIPRHPSVPLGQLFAHFASTNRRKLQNGGWLEVRELSSSEVGNLRGLASKIMERSTRCGLPRVTLPDGREIPSKDNNILEYCMWDVDFVSSQALDNFGFEQAHWRWVVRAFEDLYSKHPTDETKDQQDDCRLGFLDIGVNVGDWISPIRLLAPKVPIFGVEGSPGTAAIAAANLWTSVEYHNKQQTPTRVASSMILPFSLAPLAQAESINLAGGVCFSKPHQSENMVNIGGRSVQSTNLNNCPASGAAGATTLEHALKALATTTACANRWNDDKGPRIYILKVDVEGHEFKALSSVVLWLARHTPCYIVVEYWKKPSYNALMELLIDLGYDAVWRTNEKEYPPDEPWWTKAAPGKGLHQEIADYTRRHRYTELVFGFRDVASCVARLQRK